MRAEPRVLRKASQERWGPAPAGWCRIKAEEKSLLGSSRGTCLGQVLPGWQRSACRQVQGDCQVEARGPSFVWVLVSVATEDGKCLELCPRPLTQAASGEDMPVTEGSPGAVRRGSQERSMHRAQCFLGPQPRQGPISPLVSKYWCHKTERRQTRDGPAGPKGSLPKRRLQIEPVGF